MKLRKKYSKEFKLDARALVEKQNYSQTEVAQSFGIVSNVLWRWIKEQKTHGGKAFLGKGKLTEEHLELRRLKMKKEGIQWRHYQTRTEAQQDILRYIVMFYNRQRLRSYLRCHKKLDHSMVGNYFSFVLRKGNLSCVF